MNWKVFYDATQICTDEDSQMKAIEIRALLLIYQNPGILQTEVISKLNIHPSRMNRMAALFSDVQYKTSKRKCLGFITMREVADDRRCKELSLTAKGLTLVHKIEHAMRAVK
ncbi:MarR family winged helix-turn-helix transcriptional regulator [Paremcibacter congregatus]|uniref:MarR family winged helix-turn-helix transcriptional regulator n=1 Tax=Paremcibacter congregatus TaxID=2043170 RepID=UPI003A8D7D8E